MRSRSSCPSTLSALLQEDRLGGLGVLVSDRSPSCTGLTWVADAGVPVHVLQKIAGHGSLTTTQFYLHPDERSIKTLTRHSARPP